jgi:hypothetical protein
MILDPRPSVDVGPAVSETTSSRAVTPPVVVRNRRAPHMSFGEAFLVWRCLGCGALGSLDAFPAYCPECFSGRESLFYHTED